MVEELVMKFYRGKNLVNSLGVTYLHPGYDRSQIILDAYEAEVTFQFQKLQLINTYLDLYEHISDPCQLRKIAQTIINVLSETKA